MPPNIILLVFAFFLFLSVPKNKMIWQIILCQIQAIKIARHAEQKFSLSEDEDKNNDTIFKDFLVARWFDPLNTTANAYLSYLYPCPVFLSHENGDRIVGNQFTIVGQANPNVSIYCRITTNLELLGNLIPIGDDEILLETETMTDDDGNFEVNVSFQTSKTPGTKYRVFVIENSDRETLVGTEITLIQK
ncbi:hypothetical protein [Floridanema evergladense]|uniref:Macroglobulin domain-containing protein n=1 Tax=Floridaenema evergladense BLCC-F167 TaxID=3153639 RepID=A0ABV4WFM9_9CYAN